MEEFRLEDGLGRPAEVSSFSRRRKYPQPTDRRVHMSNRYTAAVDDIIRIFGNVYRVLAFDHRYYIWLEPVREIKPGSKKYVKKSAQARYSLDWAEANAVPVKGATYRST